MDDDVVLPPGFAGRISLSRGAFRPAARRARAPDALACGVAADSPAMGKRRARDGVRRDRAADRAAPRHLRGAAAVPRGAVWAGASTRTGRGWRASATGRSASSTCSRSRICVARGRQRLRARAGRDGGARVPRGASLSPSSRVAADACRTPAMRVAVVAEYYPRRHDPVLGVWAHRQALAARDAGAEVSVFVLHRLVPPRRDFGQRHRARAPSRPRSPSTGCTVHYVRYISPPRAARLRALGRVGGSGACAGARAGRPFDVVHAHNAVPAGDAVLRAKTGLPLVTSLHGGDVLWTTSRVPGGRAAVERVLAGSRLVLANSAGVERLAREHGAHDARVVHLGTDLPPRGESAEPGHGAGAADRDGRASRRAQAPRRRARGDGVTAGRSLPRDRRRPGAAGARAAAPRRSASRIASSSPVSCDPQEALRGRATAWCFVMVSTEEAFGVAYIEAMAAGIPAIGCAGEPGPEEIAAAGGGIELVAAALAERAGRKPRATARRPRRAPARSARRRGRRSSASSPGSAAASRRVQAYADALA